MGVDEWEETRLVLLGELFGTNAAAQLTEGTEGADGERRMGRKNLHNNCHRRGYTHCRDLDVSSPHTRVKPI